MELFKQDLGKKFKLHKLRTRLEENLEKRDLKIQTDEIAKIERLIRDQVDYDGDRDLDSKMIDDQITEFFYKNLAVTYGIFMEVIRNRITYFSYVILYIRKKIKIYSNNISTSIINTNN